MFFAKVTNDLEYWGPKVAIEISYSYVWGSSCVVLAVMKFS